jgi:beta-lactamase class D
MQSFVDHFGYGNGNISPAVDTFWLYGDLRISPLEQVDFLRRFCGDELGVSERTTKMVQDIMVLEETEEYVLRGKTGTAEVTPTRELGWLVGYLQRDDRVWYYALNMEGERVWEEWPPRKRKDLVIRIFRALGVLTQP